MLFWYTTWRPLLVTHNPSQSILVPRVFSSTMLQDGGSWERVPRGQSSRPSGPGYDIGCDYKIQESIRAPNELGITSGSL